VSAESGVQCLYMHVQPRQTPPLLPSGKTKGHLQPAQLTNVTSYLCARAFIARTSISLTGGVTIHSVN